MLSHQNRSWKGSVLTDLVLAIGHHLLMFALPVVLVMQMMLIRPDMTSAALARVGRLDIAYGTTAGLILLVGVLRVVFGLKGWEYYVTNLFFWAKIAAFLAVAILSISPTMRIIAWRRAARDSTEFRPATADVMAVRRTLHREAAAFVLIPVFAALMARGYGS